MKIKTGLATNGKPLGEIYMEDLSQDDKLDCLLEGVEYLLERVGSISQLLENKEVVTQESKLGIVISRLDKIIELLTPKPLFVTSSNKPSLQAIDVNNALLKLSKR